MATAKSTSLLEDEEEEIEQSLGELAHSSQDNLIISPGHVKVIDLPPQSALEPNSILNTVANAATLLDPVPEPTSRLDRLDWILQPLSGRRLAWTVNALVVLAAWLLSVLVFLSVLGGVPKWPLSMVFGAAIVVAALYWGFFRIFAGASFGTKLAQLTEAYPDHDEPEEDRFR